jgi:head-tail adaptor
MRWAPIIEDINATWRLRLGSITYNILGAANVQMANREIEALCVSGKNDG